MRLGMNGIYFGLRIKFEDDTTGLTNYARKVKEIYARYYNSKPWQPLSEYIEAVEIADEAAMQVFISNNRDKYPGEFAAFDAIPNRFLYIESISEWFDHNEPELDSEVKLVIFTQDGEQLTPLLKFHSKEHWWHTFSMDGIYYCPADTEFTVINDKNETAVFNISGEMISDFQEAVSIPN